MRDCGFERGEEGRKEHSDLPHINGHVKSAGDKVDGADLVTIEDVTDPGVEDVVVLNEGDVLGDDECDG